MAIPNTMTEAMPSYFIFRDTSPNQPFDQGAHLLFCPPKDSDELFDALRAAFPYIRSHSGRMQQAVIDFLMEESKFMQAPLEQSFTSQTTSTTATSPWPASLQSMTSDGSTWSSPDPNNLATPSFESSPYIPLQRQLSTATSEAAPSEASPAAMEQMTSVFSLSNSSQPKQRVRRKMTEDEKVEYRKRRIVKACEKCSKRKRKCDHNQQEMDVMETKPNKAMKSSNPASQRPQALDTSNQIDFNDPYLFDSDTLSSSHEGPLLQPSDDFADLLEMPLENTFDQFTSSPFNWPYSDFTLMNSLTDHYPITTTDRSEDRLDSPIRQSRGFNEPALLFDQNANPAMDHDWKSASSGHWKEMMWERLRTGQLVDKPQPTHTAHVHDAEGEAAFTFDDIHIQGSVNANGDRRNATHSSDGHVRTDQQQCECGNMDKFAETESADAIPPRSTIEGFASSDRTAHTSRGDRQQTELMKRQYMDDGNSSSSTNAATEQYPRPELQVPGASSQHPQALEESGVKSTSTTDPSTELFMLRRRIPKALHSIVDRNNVDESSVPTPLLQTENMRSHSGVNSNREGLTALHVAARNGFQDNARLLLGRSVQDTSNDASVSELLASATYAGIECEGQTSEGEQVVFQERLSDHFRRRDHFGRHDSLAAQVLIAVAGLGLLLMLLSCLPSGNNLSLLLLALASPVRGSKGTHLPRGSSSCSEMWGTLLQRTTCFSSWMADGNEARPDRWDEEIDTAMSKQKRDIWPGVFEMLWLKTGGERLLYACHPDVLDFCCVRARVLFESE